MHSLSDIISNIKSSTNIPTLLSQLAGIRPPRLYSAISAPHFIRSGDSTPSLGVYPNGCFDFSTGHFYDAISLVQLALGLDFIPAVEYLHGQPLPFDHARRTLDTRLSESQRKLDDQVEHWHSALLANPQILDYIHHRNITDTSLTRFKIGWDEKQNRIMFPFMMNGKWCYYSGRDMLNRYKLPPKLPNGERNPEYGPKYLKGKLYREDDPKTKGHECYRNVPWGLQTLRPSWRRTKTYEGVDGQEYTLKTDDPRDGLLVITEGMFDALSFAQDDWQVLATSGGFIGKNFMPEFLSIARSFREVFVCYDNDPAGGNFQKSLCKTLFDEHIPFSCGHVPSTLYGKPVKDVSDYYCAGGDLADLVKRATPGLIELARSVQTTRELAELFRKAAVWANPEDLFDLKEACYDIPSDKVNPVTGIPYARFSQKKVNFLFSQAMKPIPECDVAEMVDAHHTLSYDVSGSFYEYAGGIWQQVSDHIIHRYIADELGKKAGSGRMRSVAAYLKDIHAGTMQLNRKPVIVFPNGTLHLDEKDPAKAFTAHSESDMSTQCMTYSYNPDARAVKWEKFIAEAMSHDAAKIRLMQQMGGYVMFPDNRLQKFFYLLGDGSNGKSVFMNILEAVYGSDNCTNVQPSRLGSEFDPIALKDSMLNLCYEAKVALSGSEEALKAVTSGDSIMAAHKGVDAVKFSTRAKFFIAANKCFASDDVSYGFLRRIIFMKFDEQFTGERANKNLTKELLEELPGIFNWCYKGYRDLMESGTFLELQDQADVLNELMTQMSPTILFVRECFPANAGRRFTAKELYAGYKSWCDEGGFKRLNRIEFMKDIMLLIRQMDTGVKVIEDYEGTKIFIFPGDPKNETLDQETEQEGSGSHPPVVIAIGVGMAQGTSGQEPSTSEAEVSEGNAEKSGESSIAEENELRESQGASQVRDGHNSGTDASGYERVTKLWEAYGDAYINGEAEIQESDDKTRTCEAMLKFTLSDWTELYWYVQREMNQHAMKVFLPIAKKYAAIIRERERRE